jgi:hypothetical protein
VQRGALTVVPPIGTPASTSATGVKFAGPADLPQNGLLDLRDARPRGVFVGDRPARRFAGEAKFVLQRVRSTLMTMPSIS